MKVYAIWFDNGELWEDHMNGIEQPNIYANKEVAEKACYELNNPKFIPPSEDDYTQIEGYLSYKDYVENLRWDFENPNYKITYSVITLNLIE